MLHLLSGRFLEDALTHLPGHLAFLHQCSYSPRVLLCGGAGVSSLSEAFVPQHSMVPYSVLSPALETTELLQEDK